MGFGSAVFLAEHEPARCRGIRNVLASDLNAVGRRGELILRGNGAILRVSVLRERRARENEGEQQCADHRAPPVPRSVAAVTGARPSASRSGIRRRRGRLSAQESIEPREISLVAIFLVRGCPNTVALARIDHEGRLDAEAAKALIELLGLIERHVPVLLAAQHQRRCLHVRDVSNGRHLRIELAVLPRQSELLLPLSLVVIGSVARDVVRLARAGDRRFEPRRLRDDVVRQDPAVAPSADAEPVRIAN